MRDARGGLRGGRHPRGGGGRRDRPARPSGAARELAAALARCSPIPLGRRPWGRPGGSASRSTSAGRASPRARRGSTSRPSRNSAGRQTLSDVPEPGSLAHLRGFVFDLDGCVWNGSILEPGAREALFALHRGGRAIGFLSNNSRATGEDLRRRLHGHGISIAEHVVTPLEIIGEVIAERFGRSRVLVMGAAETRGRRAARRPRPRRVRRRAPGHGRRGRQRFRRQLHADRRRRRGRRRPGRRW